MHANFDRDAFERACKASEGLSIPDLIDQEVLSRPDGGMRFRTLKKHMENYGYRMEAAPLIGRYDAFCDHLQEALDVLDLAVVRIRKEWRTRGYSKATLKYLHRALPNVGNFTDLSDERRDALRIGLSHDRRGRAFEQRLRRELRLQ